MKTLLLILRPTSLFLFTTFLFTKESSFASTRSSKKVTDQSTEKSLPIASSKIEISSPEPNSTKVSILGASYNLDSLEKSSRYEVNYLYNTSSSELSLLAGYYPQTKMGYYAVPTAYTNWSVAASDQLNFNLSLGRKKISENFADSHWNLGAINPYFSLDRLNYITQGVVGLHTDFSYSLFTLGVTYSPVHLPNQGPPLKIDNGQVIGANSWTQSVPETFTVDKKENRIFYKLKPYEMNKIILNNGFYTYAQIGQKSHNQILFKTQYSYSPMNDIVIGRTVIADLNLDGNVDIYPVIRYSKKMAADIEYNYSNWTYKLSYLNETPENQLEQDGKAVQTFEAMDSFSFGISTDLSSISNMISSVELAYAQFDGGDITDLNDDGTPNTFNISQSRLLFKNPISVGMTLEPIQLFKKNLQVKANWIYDLQQEGSIFSVQAKHHPFKNTVIGLGVDLIGTLDNSEENQKYFISKHKTNDRITGSFEYVF